MAKTPAPTGSMVTSPWLIVPASLMIIYHLGSIILSSLTALSGPWVTSQGPNMGSPPQFAFVLHTAFASPYLNLIRIPDNYHFMTNRPGLPGVYFEVKLKDEQGKDVGQPLRFPDEKANFWVRQRQEMLARYLAEDMPVQPPPGERVGGRVRNVNVWNRIDKNNPRKLQMKTVPEHESRDYIPAGEQMVYGPPDWTWTLAKSYGRYLCQARGAASAEIIRHSQDSIPPMVLFMGEPQPGQFDEVTATFGELPR